MDEIRAISYSFDGKSIIRRQVGRSINVTVGNDQRPITIKNIERENNRKVPVFKIYGINDEGEYGLWKEVRSNNVEVEYNISDLLYGTD